MNRSEINGEPSVPRPADALVRPLHGLEKICRAYGRMKCGDTMMAWDYANEVAVPEMELKADKARWAASEKARWSNATGERPETRSEDA